jgi:formylglycine-generating enzyme required for sulfatase activity/curved DNA-binding protein CbpA
MDPYKILQVDVDAEPETIRAAYRSLLRRYHPDKNPGQTELAEKKTRELNAAYALLSDADKRREHDRKQSTARTFAARATKKQTGEAYRSEPAMTRVTEDAQYTVLRNEVQRLETDIARLKNDNRTLRGQVEQLSAQLSRREEDLQETLRRLSDVDGQRLRLERALAVSEKQCEILRLRPQVTRETPARPTLLTDEPRRSVPSDGTAERAREPRNVTLPGGDQTLTFVWVPGGTVDIGSPVGKPDERPVHPVTLDGFWMGVFPVTHRQFAAFVRLNPQWSKRVGGVERHADYLRDFIGDTPPKGRENCPVTGVTWHAAAAFCEWAGVELPTEAQWEVAARSGRRYDYATSNGALLPRLANYNANVGSTTPIRRFPPNPYGICDMSGNVWEWCVDEYSPDFYAQPDATERNPVNGPALAFRDRDWEVVAPDSVRVIRGGSWRSVSADVRTSARAFQTANLPTLFCGFRCVLRGTD